MAYAELSDVASRAGRLWIAFSDETNPSYSDVEQFIQDESDKVDSLIAARGYTLPVEDESALGALRDVVANGALIQAVEGMFPGGAARAAANEHIADKRADYKASTTALEQGTFPALVLLGSGASAPGATDFWSENEDYGRTGAVGSDGFTTNPALAPGAWRTMQF